VSTHQKNALTSTDHAAIQIDYRKAAKLAKTAFRDIIYLPPLEASVTSLLQQAVWIQDGVRRIENKTRMRGWDGKRIKL